MKNVGFWDLPRPPSYDEELIAIWRLYSRLHQRIADYSSKCAQEAHETGTPIVRPLFLVDPQSPESLEPLVDLPLWTRPAGFAYLGKGRNTQPVYLPGGSKWRDAWNPEKIYDGGQSIVVHAPIYTRYRSLSALDPGLKLAI
jgi:alpha-D-xyloside xylohydrolase